MVGGRVIEIAPLRKAFGYPPKEQQCYRLWVVGTGDEEADECAVHVAIPDDGVLPSIGQEIWWQGGKVFFDGDRRELTKLGYSFDPHKV
jgi:hypothetical protein